MRQEDKEYMDAILHGMKAEMKAGFDLIGYKQDEMIKHQKITNGRVNQLEDKTTILATVRKYKVWIIVGFVVFWLLIRTIDDNFNITKTMADRLGLVQKIEQAL